MPLPATRPVAGALPRHRRGTAVAQVLAAAVLWAVSGVVARSLFRRAVDPAHLVQVRMLVGGLALLPVAAARGTARLAARSLPGVAAYALVLATVQLTYFEAIAVAGVAVAIFLQYTAPLLVAAWEARARAARRARLGHHLLPGHGERDHPGRLAPAPRRPRDATPRVRARPRIARLRPCAGAVDRARHGAGARRAVLPVRRDPGDRGVEGERDRGPVDPVGR